MADNDIQIWAYEVFRKPLYGPDKRIMRDKSGNRVYAYTVVETRMADCQRTAQSVSYRRYYRTVDGGYSLKPHRSFVKTSSLGKVMSGRPYEVLMDHPGFEEAEKLLKEFHNAHFKKEWDMKNVTHVSWQDEDGKPKTGKLLIAVCLQKAFETPETERVLEYIRTHRSDYSQIIAPVFWNHNSRGEDNNKNYQTFLQKESPGCERPLFDGICSYMLLPSPGYGVPSFASGRPAGFLEGRHIDLIGCDTDGAVLAAAFQLWDRGCDFSILTDYCYSTGGEEAHINAVKLMRRIFGTAVA